MKLYSALLVGFLSLAPRSSVFADEPTVLAQNTPKEKKKPAPTPTPTPAPVVSPSPLPPKVDGPPQTSKDEQITLAWGTEAHPEESKGERPPAPGTVRLSWSTSPQQEAAKAEAASSKRGRLSRAIHKLPFLRKAEPRTSRFHLRGRLKK